ncbi:Ribonuclease H-like superfamily protein [Gossypium australe]|uniref:Ribonuclease H-like superfamily protein n=1 Tax=Gossypium australe TaxID=47621 RepID=A0A5B6VZX7_9ROSI|nr:Ribonuclease H-like superfamily protein [Gossypium australe]
MEYTASITKEENFIKSVLQAIPNYAMSCFLLPKTLCGELENIFAKYWWQHGKKQKGIHWCQWKLMCYSKEDGGMGFKNMSHFNVSLLAKQGWRIINNEDSLVTRVLKAKYFPNNHFLNSILGNTSSYTWKSIWATKDILKKGLFWRVGTCDNISISSDAWIPGSVNFRLSTEVDCMRDLKVNVLIDEKKMEAGINRRYLLRRRSARILRILLAEIPHDDLLVWEGEASGKFSVRSAYKLLQITENNPRAYALQAAYKKFYKKLWLLNLPTKMNITIWRISWNYLPTKANMRHRRLVNDASCPRCGERAETIDHLFRECPVTVEVWSELILQEVLIENHMISGIVARNDEGGILFSCSEIHKKVTSAFAAEALACRKAVKMGIENMWSDIVVEGFALTVIKKCKNKVQDKSMIEAYISDIHQMIDRQNLTRSKHFAFSHIPRSANVLAHTIAKESLKRREEFYLEKKISNYAEGRRLLAWIQEPD